MKRRGLYLVLAIIAAGIVSFTSVTGNQHKTVTPQNIAAITVQTNANSSQELNNNGSTRQVSWQESDTVRYVKTFTYSGHTVNITEKRNDKTIREESGELKDGILMHLNGKLLIPDGTVIATYQMKYEYSDEGRTLRVLYGNGDRHDYVYDVRKNLIETKWYNRSGDIMVTAKKQYFPKLPDAYTVYHRNTDSVYASFIPVFAGKSSIHNRMADKAKARISFDGKYNYLIDLDGYVLSY